MIGARSLTASSAGSSPVGTHVSGSLEVLPHRRYVELHDHVVAQLTDPAVIERDELHTASARRFAARSTTIRMSPLNGRTIRQ